MHPWHLDDGLRFEDAEAILKWGTPFAILRTSPTVTVFERATSVHLSWPPDRFLGGITATAKACQILEAPNPRAYQIYLPTLHHVSLDLHDVHSAPRAAHRQLRRIHDDLVWGLGPAAFSYPDYSRNLPAIFWSQGSLTVSLGPKLGSTELVITIEHEPQGYEELKREAAAIRSREGEGARVDHVAWHAPFDEEA